MSVNVPQLAALAKLGLTEEQQRDFPAQMQALVDYVSIVQEIETDLPPAVYPHEVAMTMREDAVRKEFSREQLLANAPDTDGEGFLVPRVLE